MTIYNSGPYLKEAIDSLLGQSFSDWELIAVENGSSDESMEILSAYQDRRIRVFPFSENIGRTPALRFAFEQARAEFIAVLDSDDVSRSDRFSIQVSFLESHPEIVLVGTWAEYIDESSNIFSTCKLKIDVKQLHDCLSWMNPIIHSSAMFRTSAAKAVGGYPEELVYAQDFGLIIALAQRGRIAIIPKLLCQFRVINTSMSQSLEYALIAATEGKMLFHRALKVLNLSNLSYRRSRRAVAVCDIKIGIILIKQKNIITGIRALLKGIMSDPTALLVNGKTKRILASFLRD
jgi:glycosyltransferase involved in cell wall biosynthesis